AFEHVLELGLLVLPLLGAIIIAALGSQRGQGVRWVSVCVTTVCLAFALLLAWRFMSLERASRHASGKSDTSATFTPRFVPGANSEKPHSTTWELLPVGAGAVQFNIGIDGLNVWLIVLTAL